MSFVGIQFCQYWKDVFRANREVVHWYRVSLERWGILPFVVFEKCPKSVCLELTFVGGLGNDIAHSIFECGFCSAHKHKTFLDGTQPIPLNSLHTHGAAAVPGVQRYA